MVDDAHGGATDERAYDALAAMGGRDDEGRREVPRVVADRVGRLEPTPTVSRSTLLRAVSQNVVKTLEGLASNRCVG